MQAGKAQLLKRLAEQLSRWVPLLQRFLRSEDDQVELLLTLEEFCGEEGSRGDAFGSIFPQVGGCCLCVVLLGHAWGLEGGIGD